MNYFSDGRRILAVIAFSSLVAPSLCNLAFAGKSAGGLSLQDVIDGISARQQRLSACHVVFHWSAFNASNASRIYRARDFDVIRSMNKVLMIRSTYAKADNLKMGYSAVAHIAWDGHRRTSYQERMNVDPIHRYSGDIAAEAGWVIWSGYWAWAILDFTPDTDGMSIAHLVHMGTWKLIGRKRIGGYDAWGIGNVGVIGPQFIYDTFEIWVVPDHDFAIVRMSDRTHLPHGKTMQGELTNVKLKRWGSLWALSYGEIRVTNPYVNSVVSVNAFDVHAFSLGVPAKAQFAVKFPIGALSFDEITQTSFIPGKLVLSRRPDGSFQVIPITKFPEYASMTDYTKGLTAAEWEATPWAAPLKQAIASTSSAGAAKAEEHGK